MVLAGAGGCAKSSSSVEGAPDLAAFGPSCTQPPASVGPTGFPDVCILNPGGVCEGYQMGCGYIDPVELRATVLCRKTCEAQWEVKVVESFEAPTPEPKSYSEQYEEHGL